MLAHVTDQLFGEDLRGRIASIDSAAAPHFALVRAQRTRAGRPNRVLVTRNTKDFEGIEGLTVLNPWHEK